ncbi:MAG: hypothetical protein KAS26_04255 [Sulfurimonas sp.]|nr:hypothetical protein [Sulfurimonas sp.]
MYTQPTRKITFTLNVDEPIDFNLLDDWLTSVLKIEIDDGDNTVNPIESLIERKLLFIKSLLQAILLPCFDMGTILKLDQNLKTPSKWTVQVAVVNIDNIPNILYQTIINFTIKNIDWMTKNPKTIQNIEYLYGLIQKEIINKFKRMVGSGKSTMPMLRVAHQQNIPFFYLGGGTYQLGCGAKSRQVSRSTTDLDSNIGAKMSNNKMLTSNLIRMAGLPAPVNGVASNIQNATTIANKIGWPIVVKPVNADRGEGVTIGVKNNKQLKSTFKEAQRFSSLSL